MNEAHESNRRFWNNLAPEWKQLRDKDELWRKCLQEPDLAFDGGALSLIQECFRDLSGKKVCVVGSGDNYAVFALAGLGARVTSTDISERQLEIAEDRARHLGLEINFVRTDAAELDPLGTETFDLVCSTNGFFVWIADLAGVFGAINRVLKPGGFYIFYDIHPFQRPWKDQPRRIEIEKPYWNTGPFKSENPGHETYEFNWTLADILNSLAGSGLVLRRLIESPAKDSRFWQDHSYVPGTDASLLDWRQNPLAGLPVWLMVAAQKANFG